MVLFQFLLSSPEHDPSLPFVFDGSPRRSSNLQVFLGFCWFFLVMMIVDDDDDDDWQ